MLGGDGLIDRQNPAQLIRLIDGPVLLRGEANTGAIGTTTREVLRSLAEIDRSAAVFV